MITKTHTNMHSKSRIYNTEEFEEESIFSRNNNKTSFSNISNKESSLKQTMRDKKLYTESMEDCKNIDELRVRSNIIDSSSPLETSHGDDANSPENQKYPETTYCQSTNEEENIELIYCEHCGKSYAPETSKKFCQSFDEEGNPKCLRLKHKKRKAFNSAKMRIVNNTHLQPEEKRVVISGRKKVVAELRKKVKGIRSKKRNENWKKQSDDLREAMKCNRMIAKAKREGKPAHYYL